MTFELELKSAHSHCLRHKAEIARSKTCGCFHCKSTFPPSKITVWLEEEETALCPNCMIDSVIGDASGYPVADEMFLSEMHQFFFQRTMAWEDFERLSHDS